MAGERAGDERRVETHRRNLAWRHPLGRPAVILSVSRRTDVPALYAPWFAHRLRVGWCEFSALLSMPLCRRCSTLVMTSRLTAA